MADVEVKVSQGIDDFLDGMVRVRVTRANGTTVYRIKREDFRAIYESIRAEVTGGRNED